MSKTIYRHLLDKNKDHLNDIAIEFSKEKISYQELFENIDLTAQALTAKGVKKGDIVGICQENTKEAICLLYALSKIGAVARFIDPKEINNPTEELKFLISDESQYLHLKRLTKQKMVVIPRSKIKAIGKIIFGNVLLENEDISWDEFIENGKNKKVEEVNENLPVAVVHEGGKRITLSNQTIIDAAEAYEKELDLKRDDRFYGIDQTWNTARIMTTIHFPLVKGLVSIIDPNCDRNSFIKNVLKKKPNCVAAPSFIYDSFLNERLVRGKEFRFLKKLIELGKPLREDQAKLLEDGLLKHNCFAKLIGQYTEGESGLVSVSNSCPYESIGKAVKKVSIVDENNNQLPAGERGELVIEDKIKTRTLASIDEEGNIYTFGKTSDYLTRGNMKVYLFDIKRIIETRPGIEACDVKIGNGRLIVTVKFSDYYMNDFSLNDRLLEANLIGIQRAIYEIYEDESIIPCIFNVVSDKKTTLYLDKENAIEEHAKIKERQKTLK